MQARYYSSTMGRFTSPDTFGGRLTNPQTLNLYAYVLNNPLKYNDPTGVSLIPFVGNALEVRAYYHEGHYGRAAIYGALTVSDVFLVKSLAVSAIRGIAKVGAREATERVIVKEALVESGVKTLGDDALVVRGGQNLPENFLGGTGVTVDSNGLLQGVSVNSASGRTVQELSVGIKNGQVGVTSVGNIRAAGGDVVPDLVTNPSNPFHCTMCGITAEKASGLFRPTIRNPNRP